MEQVWMSQEGARQCIFTEVFKGAVSHQKFIHCEKVTVTIKISNEKSSKNKVQVFIIVNQTILKEKKKEGPF